MVKINYIGLKDRNRVPFTNVEKIAPKRRKAFKILKMKLTPSEAWVHIHLQKVYAAIFATLKML